MYFSIFEKYLTEHGLPLGLKYLPVVESALDPKAVSRVGAVGLWQFMPKTARETGLKINAYVDERCDPNKSTEAAMRYLIRQYERFGDWALALAAYNGGAGRVSRAIKRARSKNFWQIRRYLPKETRNYVPAFIAAGYLLEYYGRHNLHPQYPGLDLQLTETIKVHGSFSFYQIAQITGLPLNIINKLNPAYAKGFIPSNPEGNFLVLPRRVMQAIVDFQNTKRPAYQKRDPLNSIPVYVKRSEGESNREYLKIIYVAGANENLEYLAKKLNCPAQQIRAWNGMRHDEDIQAGQKIIFFRPKEIKRFLPRAKIKIQAIPALTPQGLLPIHKPFASDAFANGKYLYYIVKKKERLRELAKRIPEVTLGDLMALNNLRSKQIVKAGTRLKIFKL